MVDVTVRGANELERLGRRLKAAGAGELKKELLRGIRASNKPTIAAVRASARERLPQRGGLAALVAGSRIGTRTRLTGQSVGVQIKGTGKVNVSGINDGFVRHPVFGNRKVFVTQQVAAGWFDEPIEKAAPAIRKEIQAAMSDVARKIEKG